MPHIHQHAQKRPRAQHAAAARRRAVQAEVVHGRVVEPVQHVEPRAQVVELLGQAEVARVEEARGGPRGDADVGEDDVEGPQGGGGRDRGADLVQAVEVRPEVERREEHREGLLDAEDAREGPFAVELDDGLVGGQARGRDYGLAGVVAFGGAVPEKEAVVEGWWVGRGMVS